MNKYILILAVLLIILGGGYYFIQKSYSVNSNLQTIKNSQNKVLFSASPDVSYAYKIFPGPLDEKAGAATVNYNINYQTQNDGSTKVILVPKEQEEKIQQYTVKSGETLYFVEKFPGDDTVNKDKNLKDDYGIVVDNNGYIVSQ